jgi:hypothetical protein
MPNPETFMENIEQEWTIQRHSLATLSKNGQSRDIHGHHSAIMDNPETFIIAQCCPWMSLDCPFLLNVAHECLWIVHSCSLLPMNVSGLSIFAQCCPCMSLDCPLLPNVANNPETFMGNIEQEWTI